MATLNVLGACKICNRSRDFERSMVAACRETELRDRSLQHGHAVSIERATVLDLTRLKHRVWLPLSRKHAITGGLYTHTNVI